ncbi:hypothetical protein BGP_4983 [Beggiatoa sp. PS]|nr:hypothetical protein BGP_4983 [Beggiatoa sp. PS]
MVDVQKSPKTKMFLDNLSFCRTKGERKVSMFKKAQKLKKFLGNLSFCRTKRKAFVVNVQKSPETKMFLDNPSFCRTKGERKVSVVNIFKKVQKLKCFWTTCRLAERKEKEKL